MGIRQSKEMKGAGIFIETALTSVGVFWSALDSSVPKVSHSFFILRFFLGHGIKYPRTF
jgi:hypothetical protein